MRTTVSGSLRSNGLAVLLQLTAALLAMSCGKESVDREGAAGTNEARVAVARAALEDGEGREIIEIDTCAELQGMQNGWYAYRITANFSCASFDYGDGHGFMPLGTFDPWEPIIASLDGQGHVITGLTIDRPNTTGVGLYAMLGAPVQNLGLVNVNIVGFETVGGLAGFGHDYAFISNVYVTGSVEGYAQVGGIVGRLHAYSGLSDSYSLADVTSTDTEQCGLVVGKISGGDLDRLYSAGTLTGCPATVLGYAYEGTKEDSFFDCDLAGNCTDDDAETTETMQTPSHFDTAGWDVEDVWGFTAAASYPCLRWQGGCGDPGPACASTDVTCDAVDDDCSGTDDEDYVSTSTSCGVGACSASGSTSCVSGAVQNSCTAGTPAADTSCNGVDNDCDTHTDEAYSGTATSCGVGACAATGTSSCVSGSVQSNCTPGTPAADISCNGVDNDCDTHIDEAYVSTSTSCGVGACGATGTTSCVSGSVQNSCTAGTPTADTSCNGVDNDCDTHIDEAYVSSSTSCGVGACGATGTTSCVSGSVQNSCTAGTPTADTSCNGVDNDCDTHTDEAYSGTATSCGVGACAATGTSSCVSGSVQSNCTPGTPAADTSCNGVDNDCDGNIDEAYSGVAASCGVGACVATGTSSCVSGSVQSNCTPGTPGSSDSTCNGIDNDCDGRVDEDYVSSATQCGIGECAAVGEKRCVAGGEVDDCEADAPSTDADCDLQDDDCDGSIDEGYPFECDNACSPVQLLATRGYQPTMTLDAFESLDPPEHVHLPLVVPVIEGNAGTGGLTLTYQRSDGESVSCAYQSGGDAAHPATPEEFGRQSLRVAGMHGRHRRWRRSLGRLALSPR